MTANSDWNLGGIRRIAITWVNNSGAVLVKVVPATRFEAAIREGVGFSPVADAFGSDGAIDPGHHLAHPDGDLRLRADPSALAPLEPNGGWGWAPGVRWDRACNAPYSGDQRHFCFLQQQRLDRVGVELNAGFELEWMVLSTDADGAASQAIAGSPYGADRLIEGLDYTTAVLDALDATGLPWLQFHPEYGRSQFELSLAPGSALEAADRLVLAKLIIQRQTQRLGLRCSFSPKPWLSAVGNGGHLHLSLQRHGRPLLQGGDETAGLTAEGAAVLATLLDHLPALLPLACPLDISYRRMAPSSWAAPFQVWGVENREAALRLVPTAADGAAAHLELKLSDLGANPYLLLGAVQALALHGLEHPVPLPDPVIGDPAARMEHQARRLPRSLAEASEFFAASVPLREAMGDVLHRALLDSHAAEARHAATFTEEDLVEAYRLWPLVGKPC